MRAALDMSLPASFTWRSACLSWAVLVMGLWAGAAWAADPVPADDGATVLIHTAAGDVTVADARANLAVLSPMAQLRMLHDPDGLSNMVRLIAAQKVLLNDAESKGWDKRPDVVNAIQAARNNILLEHYVSGNTPVQDDYPSDADLHRAYDASKSAFATPTMFHYARIVIAAGNDPQDQDKAKARIADIQQRLQKPDADFNKIAASENKGRRSDMTSPEDQLPADVRQSLTALKPGAISAPIQTKDGWCILKLLDVVPAGTRSFEEVRAPLRVQMRAARAQQAAKAYVDSYVQKMPVPSPDALALVTGQPHP